MGQGSQMDRSTDKSLIKLLLFVFLLRLLLSFLPSFEVDMSAWLAWAARLKTLGPAHFYSETVWTQYMPGFLYWLWFLAKLNLATEFWIKLTVIAADIFTGLLIWQITKKKSFFLFYVLNPAIVFVGSIWGQIDGILTLFLLLAVYFLVFKKQPAISFVFWGIAFLIKPQAIAVLPFLIFFAFRKFPWRRAFSAGLSGVLTLSLGSILFFPKENLWGLFKLVRQMGEYYGYTSVFAFNFWSLVGMWKPDSISIFGLPYFYWGLILYLLALGLIFIVFRNRIGQKTNIFLFTALLAFAFFLFPTRVHERYLFPALAFLLAAGRRKLYFLASLLFLVNLYHPYAHYSDNFLSVPSLLRLSGQLAPVMAVGFLLIFWRVLNVKK